MKKLEKNARNRGHPGGPARETRVRRDVARITWRRTLELQLNLLPYPSPSRRAARLYNRLNRAAKLVRKNCCMQVYLMLLSSSRGFPECLGDLKTLETRCSCSTSATFLNSENPR